MAIVWFGLGFATATAVAVFAGYLIWLGVHEDEYMARWNLDKED